MRRSLCSLAVVLVSAALYNVACSSSSDDAGNVGGSGGSETQDGAAGKAEAGGASGQGGHAGQAGKGGQAGTAGAAGMGGGAGGQAGQGGAGGQGGKAGEGGSAGGSGMDGAGGGQAGVGGEGGSAGEDGGIAGAAGDGGPSNCVTISGTGMTGAFLAARVSGTVTPNLGQAQSDVLYIQLYELDSFKQTPGTFDLGQEAGYTTCNHCVSVYQDSQDGIFADKYYFQTSGTIEILEVSSPPSGQSKGILKNVKLIEYQYGMMTPVPGGQCLVIDSMSWNTISVPVEAGTPCNLATECGSVSQNVCDPKTSSCQPYGCKVYGDMSCADGETCVEQVENVNVGACYVACVPFGSPCPNGFQCTPLDDSLAVGICKAVGSGAANAACDPAETAVGSGCVDKFICQQEAASKVCRELCDFFNDNATCTANDQYCVEGGFCTPVAGDSASINAPCTEPAGTPCGLSGKSYRGKCTATATGDGGSVVCAQVCRTKEADDCPDGTFCSSDWYTDPVGVCL